MVSPGFVRNVDRAKSKKVVSTFSHQPLSPGSSIPPESHEIGSQALSPASRQLLNELYDPDWDAFSVPDVGTIGGVLVDKFAKEGPDDETALNASTNQINKLDLVMAEEMCARVNCVERFVEDIHHHICIGSF